MARPGRVEEREIEPLTMSEARAIVAVASTHRNSVRWELALSFGLRQGEVLGLQRDDVISRQAR